ncbi:MAG: hypothetical protein ACTS3F_12035 [Phycisphaerales bacterium]
MIRTPTEPRPQRPSPPALRPRPAIQSPTPLAILFTLFLTTLFATHLTAPNATAQLNIEPEQLDSVGTADKRGTQVDPELSFTGFDGQPFRIARYFDAQRPVILLLAYYDCPLLCDLMIDSARVALNENEELRPGDDYHLLVVSIDHTNTLAHAQAKRDLFLARLAHQDLTDDQKRSIQFAISEPTAVRALADQVGYYYRYLPKEQEFAHPPAIYFLTPTGVVSSMLLGVNTPPKQVRIALADASEGRTAGLFDNIAFSCFAYDPATGKYTLHAMNVMRLGASGAAIILFSIIGALFLRSWLRNRRTNTQSPMDNGKEPRPTPRNPLPAES